MVTQPCGWAHWWAHFEFTRINTTPTFLPKKIEDLREARASMWDCQLNAPVICAFGPLARDQLDPVDQLSRKTCAGSIRDARYAGSQPASAPTAARTAADPASVAGSRGPIP